MARGFLRHRSPVSLAIFLWDARTAAIRLPSVAIALSLATLLAGCAGTGGTGSLNVTGDEMGGRIPNGMSDVRQR